MYFDIKAETCSDLLKINIDKRIVLKKSKMYFDIKAETRSDLLKTNVYHKQIV
jgi:hypothetical protein